MSPVVLADRCVYLRGRCDLDPPPPNIFKTGIFNWALQLFLLPLPGGPFSLLIHGTVNLAPRIWF